ncbi:hypothetical protein [Paucibacter soli]|uniref:hypothetical protein n=1 Tax=Paucibacter soli TaxID=3133433 RepID=UPI0030B0BEC4
MTTATISPARKVRVHVGRKTYIVVLNPDTGAVLYVKGSNGVRGEFALDLNGRAARAAIAALPVA